MTRLASLGVLIIAALLTLAATFSANAAFAADENQSISILRNDHVINFGENITFDLEISSASALPG